MVISSSENRLEIKEGIYVFRAELDRDGFIHFIILNEIQGQRSDNLYPSQLFDLVLERWKTKIKGISIAWYPDGGTNITQFNEAKGQGLSDKEALFSTWTGRLAQKHGFTEIDEFAEEDGLVVANMLPPSKS